MTRSIIPNRTVVQLTAALLVMGGCGPSTLPTESERQSASLHAPDLTHGRPVDKKVPFRGEYRSTNTRLSGPGEAGSAERCDAQDLFTLTFELEGHASHVGRFTGSGSNCTPFPLPGPVAFGDGIFLITAANGDELFGSYEGVQSSIDAAARATFAAVQRITGGTGRFTNASGLAEEDGIIDFSSGATSARLEGWIIYDAAGTRR